jgi:hypothetical protein
MITIFAVCTLLLLLVSHTSRSVSIVGRNTSPASRPSSPFFFAPLFDREGHDEGHVSRECSGSMPWSVLAFAAWSIGDPCNRAKEQGITGKEKKIIWLKAAISLPYMKCLFANHSGAAPVCPVLVVAKLRRFG